MPEPSAEAVADYCAAVEQALRRRTTGHLTRITGADFSVVLGWAQDGVPLGVVERAMDDTAERQRSRGQAPRIRVAFLDGDVRRCEREYRRAAGPGARPAAPASSSGRIRNCPAPPVGCGAMERGADDRCLHCGWSEMRGAAGTRPTRSESPRL